jgi:hypothetical protein
VAVLDWGVCGSLGQRWSAEAHRAKSLNLCRKHVGAWSTTKKPRLATGW